MEPEDRSLPQSAPPRCGPENPLGQREHQDASPEAGTGGSRRAVHWRCPSGRSGKPQSLQINYTVHTAPSGAFSLPFWHLRLLHTGPGPALPCPEPHRGTPPPLPSPTLPSPVPPPGTASSRCSKPGLLGWGQSGAQGHSATCPSFCLSTLSREVLRAPSRWGPKCPGRALTDSDPGRKVKSAEASGETLV